MTKPSKDTIEIETDITGKITVDVEFYYTPAERETRDDPGCPAEFEIESVFLKYKNLGDSGFYYDRVNLILLFDNGDTFTDIIIEAVEKKLHENIA